MHPILEALIVDYLRVHHPRPRALQGPWVAQTAAPTSRVIQQTLNHRDIRATAIYTRVPNEQIAAAQLELPESWGRLP